MSRSLAYRSIQGCNEGARGAQCPLGAESLGPPKSPNNVASTFCDKVHLLPKDLRFKHGGAKLVSCPGRHFTSVRPWLYLKIFALGRIGHNFRMLYLTLNRTLLMAMFNHRKYYPPFTFSYICIDETDTHKHLGRFSIKVFPSTPIFHIHIRRLKTKFNRLHSFANTPFVSFTKKHLTNYYYGSIIRDNSSDGDKQTLEKAQLSTAKVILACFKSNPSTTC